MIKVCIKIRGQRLWKIKGPKTKLHDTGKWKRVSDTGTRWKHDPPKFRKRGNAIYIYIYINKLNVKHK